MTTESKRDNGGAAFPRQFQRWDNDILKWQPTEPEEGMTLRDYFAAKAMQGLLRDTISKEGYATVHGIAKDAYRMADAMLEARSAQ